MAEGKVTPQLDAQDFTLAEAVRNVHRVEVIDGITRRNVIDPAFWAHVATKLRVYDQIEIIRRDGTLFARALVTQAERTWARVHILEWHDLTTRDVALTQTNDTEAAAAGVPLADPKDGFEIKNRGQRLKWCVMRKSDGAPVHEGAANQREAESWLADYLKQIA